MWSFGTRTAPHIPYLWSNSDAVDYFIIIENKPLYIRSQIYNGSWVPGLLPTSSLVYSKHIAILLFSSKRLVWFATQGSSHATHSTTQPIRIMYNVRTRRFSMFLPLTGVLDWINNLNGNLTPTLTLTLKLLEPGRSIVSEVSVPVWVANCEQLSPAPTEL